MSRLSPSKAMVVAMSAVLTSMGSHLRGDVLYSSGMSDVSHVALNYSSSDGSVGYGDDYGTNYTTINLTGMTFYGGTTIAGEYVAIDFYSATGTRVASIFPSPSEVGGIGYHTLAASDFAQNGLPYIPITPNGYVVITPERVTVSNVSDGSVVQVPPAGVNASFSLGFGTAPTVSTNNANLSVMVTSGSAPVTGAFAPVANQYMQFQLEGTGTLDSNDGTWISAMSGSWETSSNWNAGIIASGVGQTASFGNAIGNGAFETVTLTANETVGRISFTNSRGNYTLSGSDGNSLILDNSGSVAVVNVRTLSQTINAPIVLAGGLNINTEVGTPLPAGSLTLGGAVSGTGPLSVFTSNSTLIVSPAGSIGVGLVNSGRTVFAAQTSGTSILTRHVPSLTLNAGSNITFAAASSASRQVLVTPVLSLSGTTGSWTSKLDLANNDAIIQGGDLTTINNQIKQAYNSGNWQGSGGITSTTAAANTRHLTALGAILNDDGSGSNSPLYASFDGNSSAEGDVLIKYTYLGDTNLDGKIDGSDYSRLDAAYLANQSSPGFRTGWFNGDFNYDGVINGSDYTLIDNAFNTQGVQLSTQISTRLSAQISAQISTQPAQSATSSAVPEPNSMAGLVIASLGVLSQRRKRFPSQ